MSSVIGTDPFFTFVVDPVLDTVAYASGDLLFDATPVSDFFTPFALSPLLQSLIVFDRAAQNLAFDLLFTTLATTWGALNVAAAPSDTLAEAVVGVISVAAADYVALGAGSAIVRPEFNPFHVAASGSGRAVYVVGIARGAANYAADSLRLRFGLIR